MFNAARSYLGVNAKDPLTSNVDIQNVFRSAFAAPIAIYFASYTALRVCILIHAP